jgi:hypothetical protein
MKATESPTSRQSQRHYASRRLLTHPSRRAVSRLVFNVRQKIMTEVQKFFAEAKEKQLDGAAVKTVRTDVESQLLGSGWRKISYVAGIGIFVLLAGYDVLQHRSTLSTPVYCAFFLTISLAIGYGEVYRKKTKALLRLIEKEAPALHTKITKDEDAS